MNRPSILFLNCGGICYDSTLYFEQEIDRELCRKGWHTEHLTVDKKNPSTTLKSYYGRQFDLILDINTVLPAAADEEGGLCLNRIDGAVWHYIIDHPLYHHDTLKSPLNRYHIICLDEKHAAFIREHYPHIRKVITLPLAASEAEELIPYQDRRDAILFTGTYSSPDLILNKANQQPPKLAALFHDMVQMLMEHPEMTQEEAVNLIMPGCFDELPAILQLNYLADFYLQSCIREELLTQMLLHNLPVTIYGHNWEIFARKYTASIPNIEKNLHLAAELPYSKMPEIYSNAQIALNQTPWFKAGMHDRVALALRNGCVCITEKCHYMEERLTDTQEIYYFSLEKIEESALLAEKLLKDPAEAFAAAERGRAYAKQHFGWEHWAEEFIAQAACR